MFSMGHKLSHFLSILTRSGFRTHATETYVTLHRTLTIRPPSRTVNNKFQLTILGHLHTPILHNVP